MALQPSINTSLCYPCLKRKNKEKGEIKALTNITSFLIKLLRRNVFKADGARRTKTHHEPMPE